MQIIFYIFLGFLHATYSDVCLQKEEIKSLQEQFKFQTWDRHNQKWIDVKNICEENQNSTIKNVVTALVKLKQLPPLEEIKGTWESHIIQPSPYEFFSKRVKVLRFDDESLPASCKNKTEGTNTIAAFAEAGLDAGTIRICQQAKSGNSLDFMKNLVHEAQHIPLDGKGTINSHVSCLHGIFVKSPACDMSYAIEGAYAAGLEFLIKISRTTSVSKKLRMEARKIAFKDALSHFNIWPKETVQGILLLDETGELSVFDEKMRKTSNVIENLSLDSILTLRLQLPTVFERHKRLVKSYVGKINKHKSEYEDAESLFAKKFRVEFTEQQVKNLRDVYYGEQYVCFLFSDSLYCESTLSNDSVLISFPVSMKPIQFAFMNESPTGTDFVHIVTESGDLYLLPTDIALKEWKLSDLEVTPTFHNFLSVAILQKEGSLLRLAITKDGKVVSYDNPSGPHTDISPSKVKYKKMIAPFYWSSSLDEI